MLASRHTASKVASLGVLGGIFELREVGMARSRFSFMDPEKNIAPSFRGEDPDASHLNQFFHAECELRGNMEDAMKVAEGYIYSVTKTLFEQHGDIIREMAGTTNYIHELLNNFDPQKGFPRVTNDAAIEMFPSRACWEYIDDNDVKLGRK